MWKLTLQHIEPKFRTTNTFRDFLVTIKQRDLLGVMHLRLRALLSENERTERCRQPDLADMHIVRVNNSLFRNDIKIITDKKVFFAPWWLNTVDFIATDSEIETVLYNFHCFITREPCLF